MEYGLSNLYKTWITRLFYFFFIVTLLFPVIIINKMVFISIILLMVFNYKIYRFKTIAPFVIFLIFLWGFIHSFFYYSDRAISLQFFLSTLVLFLIYPINKYKIDLDRIAKVSGIIMVIYTWISFFIVTTGLPFSDAYYDFFFNYSTGSYSLRDFVDDGIITFQMGTLPFLYLSLVLYYVSFLKEKKIGKAIILLIFFVTLALGGSRASILTTIITLVMITFIKSSNINRIRFLFISIPVVITVGSYILINTNVFDKGEVSNAVKLGHYNSFWENLNFFNFFLGEGLASYYYSEGAHAFKAYTEITPLDMLRYFGFILTPILYIYMLFPIRRITAYFGENFLFFVTFFMYVVNSMTNPTMFNSYGFLIVLWYWSKILNTSEIKGSEVINEVKTVKQ
ncbi:hypothetical protein EV143_104207 [Flavobacterium chryseum]|nr:hypothetical protein EV143_104207 [Flavobacterium sp. P3160]